MRIREVLSVASIMLATAVPPAESREHASPATRVCDIPAWIHNADPQGVAVRAAPSVDSPIRARLPSTVETEYGLPIAISITGSEAGWFQMKDPAYDPDPLGPPAPAMPDVQGWVDGAQVVVIVQGKRGRAAPMKTAVVLDEFEDGWLSDSARIDRVLDCDGQWVKVEYRHLAEDSSTSPPASVPMGPARQAWFTGLCAIQETTCDMPGAD
jgi:hypothetical protein